MRLLFYIYIYIDSIAIPYPLSSYQEPEIIVVIVVVDISLYCMDIKLSIKGISPPSIKQCMLRFCFGIRFERMLR